eukprot:9626549-Prorocentrum_lima.AAC.1
MPGTAPATETTQMSAVAQKTAASQAEYANILRGWQELRSLASTSSAFSWWPAQVPGQRGFCHSQTRLPGNREGLLIDIGAFHNLMGD